MTAGSTGHRRSGRHTESGPEAGYILVSVLIVIAVVTGLVSGILLLGRGSIDTAGLAGRDMREQALVQSAVAVAGFELFHLGRRARSVDGQQLRFDEGAVTLRVSGTSGQVDLNASGKTLLAAAYRAAGLERLAPEDFAARIMDWRDPDDDPRDDGDVGEAEQYLDAGATTRPRNADFRTIEDLTFVLGVDASDLEALRPFVTVYNAGGRLSPLSASPDLIAGLPGVTSATMADVLAARALGEDGSARLADLLLVQSALIDTGPPRTFRVEVMLPEGPAAARRSVTAVMTTDPSGQEPFRILAWHGNGRGE